VLSFAESNESPAQFISMVAFAESYVVFARMQRTHAVARPSAKASQPPAAPLSELLPHPIGQSAAAAATVAYTHFIPYFTLASFLPLRSRI
jgi:hypothetical protein